MLNVLNYINEIIPDERFNKSGGFIVMIHKTNLIVYYSHSGNTKKIAKLIQQEVG